MLTNIYPMFFFIIGTIMGSFFNVVGYRVPKKESIAFPASHCVNCNHKLGSLELIPLFSYIFLGGKCKNCKKEVSIIYPLIELLTGLLFFLSYLIFGLSIELLFSILFISFSVIVIVSDIRYMIIPDEIIFVFFTFFVVSMISINGFSIYKDILLDALVPFAFLYLVKSFGDLVFKKETMGGGDIKLMLIVGLFLGWENALIAVFLGTIIAFPISCYYYFKDKEHMMPFGPYLCFGALIISYFNITALEIIRLLY